MTSPLVPDLSAVDDIFAAMQQVKIGGVPLSDVAGGGDPAVVGAEGATSLLRNAIIPEQGMVLDVGCGCGRIAAALTQAVDERLRYVGVDIIPEVVAFARTWITERYPHFQFRLLDESHPSYDYYRPLGTKADIARLSEVAPAESFDSFFALSLLTHLDFPAARTLLQQIHQTLKPGGRGFVTIFALDEFSRAAIDARTAVLSFPNTSASGLAYIEKVEEPTYAVAYDKTNLLPLFNEAGFSLDDVIRGYWMDGSGRNGFQDAALITKR
jgi:SAM-dependent methyltransferase